MARSPRRPTKLKFPEPPCTPKPPRVPPPPTPPGPGCGTGPDLGSILRKRPPGQKGKRG